MCRALFTICGSASDDHVHPTKLTPNQVDLIYNAGREAADEYYRAKQEAVNTEQEKAKAQKKTAAEEKTTGKSTVSEKKADKEIIFEGFTYSKRKSNPVQRASMDAIEMINKMSNLEIHIYKSYKRDGKLYAVVNGKERLAPNGYFTNGNKIYIDINAGNMGEGMMLYTLSHELGHYIAKWNAQDFKAISDFLIKHYGENFSFFEQLEAQKNKLRKSYKEDGKQIPGETQLEKEAHEELVCDMLSRMLADKNAYDKLAELKQTDLKLHQKLGRAIKKLLNKIAEAIGIYDTLAPDAVYAASTENIGEEAFRQLQDMYIKAFLQADANFQAAEKNTTEDGGVRMMARENVDIPYQQHRKLLNKKPLKDSKKYFGKVKDARIEAYRVLSEEDIPDIDFLEIAEYNIVDEGYVYTIRNYDKVNFAILSRKAIRTKYDGYVMEVSSNGDISKTISKGNDGKGSQHKGHKTGNWMPGDQKALRGDAEGGHKAGNADQGRSIGHSNSDNRRRGIEVSSNPNKPTEALNMGVDKQVESEELSDGTKRSNRDSAQFHNRDTDFTKDFDYSALIWAEDLGIITGKDKAIFERTINNEIFRGAKPRTANGQYIVDTGKCLMFTNGDFHNPTLSRVIVFATEYESLTDYAKRRIIDEAEATGKVQQSLTAIESLFGVGFVSSYTMPAGQTYAWQNGGRKGSNGSRTAQKAKSLKERFADEGLSHLLEDDEDRDYLDAVKRGDMATAQDLVDETANDAGFSTKGYHGSRTPGFTVVDKYSWLWLARDESVANEYGTYTEVDNKGKPHNEKGVYAMHYNLGNNLVVYANGASWGELPVTQDEYPGVYADEETGEITTNAMAEWAARNGYDSITFVDVMDSGGFPTTVDVVFNPERDAKSADPVTYDDDGNVIPLSKRYNKFNDDLRYSDRDTESVSNRSLLANVFESMAQNDIEKQKIADYREKLETMEAEEQKLQELNKQIKELSFAKGPRDTQKIYKVEKSRRKSYNTRKGERSWVFGSEKVSIWEKVSGSI